MLLGLGLDAIDRLSFQAGRLRYRGYGNSLAQEFSNQRELVPSECWLASPIFRPVVMFLGMRDARFLGGLAADSSLFIAVSGVGLAVVASQRDV